jgi:hypothetical protein
MKKILIFSAALLISFAGFAQVDEEEYFKQMDKQFEDYAKNHDEIFKEYVKKNDAYIEKLDQEWQAFLEKKFKEFELYVEKQPKIGPKPEEIPVAEANKAPETNSIKYEKTEQIAAKPVEVNTPRIRKSEAETFDVSNSQVDFYGTDIEIDYDRNFLSSFPSGISEQTIAQKYGEMSDVNYNHLIDQLLTYSENMNLNDWGYYLLVKNASEQITSNDAGAVFLQWFLLIKSGYKARIGYRQDELFLLLPAATNIYDVPFFTFDGLKYYLINGEQTNINTYDKDFPDATRVFDLNIDNPLNTSEAEKTREVNFTFIGKAYSFDVKYNKNVIDYYQDFPLSDANVYFDATVSAATKQSLKEGLQPLLEGRSEEEATSILLRVVQTAFDYQTDQEQFGYEKFFFADELFSFPYSDCEDRSVLFAYLVKEIMQLQVIGVGYSGHMATAVRFNEEVDGDYLEYNGEKYTICDPTFINAPIGMTMPQYKNQPAKIFELRNHLNAAFAQRKLWKHIMDQGGYRGENKGDIATDSKGNTYVTGYFTGNITLDGIGLNSDNDTKDMFIAKYNKSGRAVWAQSFGSNGSEVGYALTLAPNGDIVVAGSFDENFSFGYKYLKAKEMSDILVARFTPDGKLLWASQVGLEEIGLQNGFMFLSEFKWNGTPVNTNILGEAEYFNSFGLAINSEGNILLSGAPYEVAGLNVQKANYDAGASFSAPDMLLEENSRLLENNYNPAIAGLFAVIKLINSSSISLPGSEAQKTLDRHNPNFKKRSPHIYNSIGRIQFIKNSEGIVTIRTDDQKEVSFKTLKVDNNARFKVSSFNSGNSQIDILGGVSIGKSIIWYDLNGLKLFKTGDMVMDYDIDHTKIRMRIEKDILE